MRTPEKHWATTDAPRFYGVAQVAQMLGAAPMSAISTPIRDRSDAAIEHVQRCRERVLADRPDAERSTRVAELYEREANLLSLLFQHTQVRVHWHAALAAEAYAWHGARYLVDAAGWVPGEAARS